MCLALFKFFKIILVSAIMMVIVVPVFSVIEANDAETHFSEFSEFTVVRHDNIDDTSEAHSHVHKHSKDGEEHEHDHEHSRSLQTASKIMYSSSYTALGFLESESIVGFSEKNLISDPHSFGIFRPPIV